MTTAEIIDQILRNVDEVLFPAMTAYAIWLLRNWLQKPK